MLHIINVPEIVIKDIAVNTAMVYLDKIREFTFQKQGGIKMQEEPEKQLERQSEQKQENETEEKRVTISDIAGELGLSTATVSNVLHGKTNKVSDRTVQRVQALLEERQYIPSMAGILLAQNASRIIGVVINNHEKYESHTLEDAFIASSLNFLSAEIEKNGQFMMVKQTREMEEIIRFASMWNLDGLVRISC